MKKKKRAYSQDHSQEKQKDLLWPNDIRCDWLRFEDQVVCRSESDAEGEQDVSKSRVFKAVCWNIFALSLLG